MSSWCSVDAARSLWADAPLDDPALELLLAAAQEACEAYAPVLLEGDLIPYRFTQAVAMQAQESWNTMQRDTGDVIGFADANVYARVKPLTGSVRQLLRPHRAVPAIG